MKYLNLAALLFLVACETPQSESASVIKLIADDQATAIDRVFDDVKLDGPGGALAVVQDGQVIYARGYGLADLEHNVPITPQTVFYMGSVSKQFVTFAILQLVEQGKMTLDDDVRQYIPEFPDYGVPLTIRHFIHHTSGVRDYLTLWEMAGYSYLDEIPKQAALDIICRQKELNFVPGSRYLYSNSCYFMLALIIERVTGQTMSEYGEEQIFGPLGMNNSRFHEDNTRLIDNRAFSYAWNEDESRWDNLISRFDLVGSGGIYSTVSDLFKWDQNFYNNKIGPQSLIDTLKTDGTLNDGSSADYAFAVVNDTYRGLATVSHGGALAGYRAHFLQFPDQKTSVIILSNYATFQPGRRAYEVADVILRDLLGADASEEQSGQAGASQEEVFGGEFFTDWANVTGRYYSEELDAFFVLNEAPEVGLILTVRYSDPLPLSVVGPMSLAAGGSGVLEFTNERSFRAQAGRVQNLLFTRVD